MTDWMARANEHMGRIRELEAELEAAHLARDRAQEDVEAYRAQNRELRAGVDRREASLKAQAPHVAALEEEVARLETLAASKNERLAEADGAIERLEYLLGLLGEGLASADCTWEERNEGHDWAEWCKKARAELGGGGGRRDH